MRSNQHFLKNVSALSGPRCKKKKKKFFVFLLSQTRNWFLFKTKSNKAFQRVALPYIYKHVVKQIDSGKVLCSQGAQLGAFVMTWRGEMGRHGGYGGRGYPWAYSWCGSCSIGSSAQCSVMTERGGMEGWEAIGGGHVCIHSTDSRCPADANPTP